MKSATLYALFLLSAITTSYLPSSATGFLVDTDGNPLRNGGTYYILPAIITGNGGGIEHTVLGNETCPLSVVQHRDPLCRGFPITISTPAKILNIPEGFNVEIGFTFRAPPCAPTSKWTIVKDEVLAVTLNWDKNNAVSGWFKIRRIPVEAFNAYNILFCPLDDSACGYVAVQFDRFRNRRLVVNDDQRETNRIEVMFQRLYHASSTATATA